MIRYAGKVWKCLPILEKNRDDYEKYLFSLICDLASEENLTDNEKVVLRKLKGLRELNNIATASEIRDVILDCSSILYGEGEIE